MPQCRKKKPNKSLVVSAPSPMRMSPKGQLQCGRAILRGEGGCDCNPSPSWQAPDKDHTLAHRGETAECWPLGPEAQPGRHVVSRGPLGPSGQLGLGQ